MSQIVENAEIVVRKVENSYNRVDTVARDRQELQLLPSIVL